MIVLRIELFFSGLHGKIKTMASRYFIGKEKRRIL